jgi:glycosyltransferase involved in cell wall biosynthesis
MICVFSNPTGNANARAASLGLMEAKILHEFHTTIASFPGTALDWLGAIGPLKEIRRRRFESSLQPFIRTSPFLEAGRLLALKSGFSKLVRHETGMFSIDAVGQRLDKHVASSLKRLSLQGVGAVYAYEDGALFSFREAKKTGLTCLYDLPIGYWRAARRLLAAERERWPEWASTLGGFLDSDEKLARKDEELALADRIYVASQFTKSTLKDYTGPLAPVEVIPYGFPVVGNTRNYSVISGNIPLKILFVGGLSQRKGIADLFEAVKTLGKDVTLTVVGHKGSDNCPALDAALARHHWIPSLPNPEILKLMRNHDVLIFPSLFEGFGLVITEAMSQGTPVITTDRTAGPDFIEHGKNGWLVEPGSAKAIQETIEEILRNPAVVSEAGHKAMETARKRPWEVYGKELAASIMKQ